MEMARRYERHLQLVADPEIARADGFLRTAGTSAGRHERILEELHALKEELDGGVSCFEYIKSDGTLRIAFGTRRPSDIRRFGGSLRDPHRSDESGSLFPYFDIDRRQWRCFRVDRFVRHNKDFFC